MQEEKVYYPPNSMALASRFVSYGALFSTLCSTVIIPCILSFLAIIFAILSKCKPNTNQTDDETHRQYPMSVIAKRGIITAVITIVLNLSLAGYTGYRFMYDDQFRSQFETTFEQVSGMSFDDYLEELKSSYTTSFTNTEPTE